MRQELENIRMRIFVFISRWFQLSYSAEGKVRLYAPGHLGPIKLTFLVDMECTHNLLSESAFDQMLTAMREKLEPSDTNAMVLPIMDVSLCRDTCGTLSFSTEFLVSNLSEKGVLDVTFFGRAEIHTVLGQSWPCTEGRCYSIEG